MIFLSVFRHSLSFGKRVKYEFYKILYDYIYLKLSVHMYMYIYIVHMFQVLSLTRINFEVSSFDNLSTVRINEFDP